jgi:hypothetical protein
MEPRFFVAFGVNYDFLIYLYLLTGIVPADGNGLKFLSRETRSIFHWDMQEKNSVNFTGTNKANETNRTNKTSFAVCHMPLALIAIFCLI